MNAVGGPVVTSAHPPAVRVGEPRLRRPRVGPFGARGMVTVEVAALSLLLTLVLVGALGVVAATFRLAECQVTANEVARQHARGDATAVARATGDRPAGSVVTVNTDGDVTHVTVACDAIVGPARVPLEATARVVVEP